MAVLLTPLEVQRIYSLGSPHHCTLQFEVDRKDFESWIGVEFSAIATSNCFDGNIQAVQIELSEHIPHKALPHITVSYRQGIEPVAANSMLKSCNYDVLEFSQKLDFKIEFLEWKVAKKRGRPRNKGKAVFLKAETLSAIALSHDSTADEINKAIQNRFINGSSN